MSAQDGVTRPWRCQCGKRLNGRGLSGHMDAHHRRGEQDVEVVNVRNGVTWLYWPSK